MSRFYRSGLVELVGYNLAVPDHEAYARFNENGYEHWTTLMQRNLLSFNCLFEPACATHRVNVWARS